MKTAFVKIAAIATGLTLGCGALYIYVIWYASRPKPPKQWNKTAVIAVFDYATTPGKFDSKHAGQVESADVLEFCYTLENTTDSDYLLGEMEKRGHISVMRRDANGALAEGQLDLHLPEFIPAKHKVADSCLGMTYSMPDLIVDRQQTAEFVRTELPTLRGFSLFDTQNTYEIIFPDGWSKK